MRLAHAREFVRNMQTPPLELADMRDAHNRLPLRLFDLQIDAGETALEIDFVRVLHEVFPDSMSHSIGVVGRFLFDRYQERRSGLLRMNWSAMLTFNGSKSVILVMAGFIPAIHVFLALLTPRRGCPAQGRA